MLFPYTNIYIPVEEFQAAFSTRKGEINENKIQGFDFIDRKQYVYMRSFQSSVL